MKKWFFLCGLLSASSALAGTVEVRERTDFYDVRGTTAEELTLQMSRVGPPQASGRRAWAFTSWEVRTHYGLLPSADGCRVTEPRASLEVVTTLPRWQVTGRPRSMLRARWRRMFASLVEHENVHKAHALEAAQRTASGLAALPVQSECLGAEQQARRILSREVAAARRLSRQFDHVTGFGAREGVALRP